MWDARPDGRGVGLPHLGSTTARQTEFSVSTVTPTFGGLSDLVLLAAVAYAFAGLEGASVMSEEVQDPRRNVPRALAISGVMVLGVYILISWTMMTVLPADQVTGLTGLTDTARVAGTRLVGATMGGVLGSLVALCLCLAAFGTVSAWMATCARGTVRRRARRLPAGRLRNPAPEVRHPARVGDHARPRHGGTDHPRKLGRNRAADLSHIRQPRDRHLLHPLHVHVRGAARHAAAPGSGRYPACAVRALWRLLCRRYGLRGNRCVAGVRLIPSENVADPTFFYITVFGTLAVLTTVGVGLYANGKLRRQRLEAP